jgi:hypothetical protein
MTSLTDSLLSACGSVRVRRTKSLAPWQDRKKLGSLPCGTSHAATTKQFTAVLDTKTRCALEMVSKDPKLLRHTPLVDAFQANGIVLNIYFTSVTPSASRRSASTQQQRTSNHRAWPFGVSHIASAQPPTSSAAAGTVTCCDVLRDYSEGRRSVQDVVQIANAYQGPAPHWLWAVDDRRRVILDYFFMLLSDAKRFDLLRLLIDTDPALPLTLGNFYDGEGDVRLLDVALGWLRTGEAVSSRVLLLLAVPGATRRPRGGSQHPLYVACSTRRVDPEVIHRLLDLDSDVLGLRDVRSRVPLHYALQMNPTAPFVARMVELRPETLLFKDCTGHTPVSGALLRTDGSPSPQVASALLGIVSRHTPGRFPCPTPAELVELP